MGATGPTLADFGVFTPLANPRLQLFDSTTVLIAVLPPGSYPLHLRGANQTTGEALVSVYELP